MGFTGWNRSKEVCTVPLNTLESNHKLGSAELQSAPSPWINKLPLVLRSSKAVNKNAPPMPGRFGRSSPYPRLRFAVQLPGGDPRRLIDLVAVGEVHPG